MKKKLIGMIFAAVWPHIEPLVEEKLIEMLDGMIPDEVKAILPDGGDLNEFIGDIGKFIGGLMR
ncbi:hypothetical protein FDH96_gp041 [Mycobacterium phage Rey]|uniref:Uncharacterized protein n=1 Tax=Mycobacterium phage Rey TaxID=1034115 RepID=G1D5A3_9CAUD|nr:hypothetical protein FDH96_gp041 [Mycobacterium phage Rey]AEK09953.1 hypothetical protein PBI_REY_41 [Mycobacterium phage Rey]